MSIEEPSKLLRSGGAAILVEIYKDLFGWHQLSLEAKRTNWVIASQTVGVEDPRNIYRRLRGWCYHHRALYERYAALLEDGLRLDVHYHGESLLASELGERLVSDLIFRNDLDVEKSHSETDNKFSAVIYLNKRSTNISSTATCNSQNIYSFRRPSEEKYLLRHLFPDNEPGFDGVALKLEEQGITKIDQLTLGGRFEDIARRSNLTFSQSNTLRTWLLARQQ